MGTTFVETVQLTTINCKCGGTYAINERYREEKYKVGGSWTCPYCQTGWGYSGNSENEKLRSDLEAEQRRLVYERQRHDQTKAELRETENKRRAEKAAKTRLKNRAAKGCCPCCNRYFANLHRHIESQHPEFASSP